MAEELEFGGYVDPPSHLTKDAARQGAGGPAELRTVPDYDYSLYRYSKLALPFLVLILIAAAVVMGLTFWQGPWEIENGNRGARDGVPRDFDLTALGDDEGGLTNELMNFRWANFVLGVVGLVIAVFAIRAELQPGGLKALLLFAALLFFALFVTSGISFGIGVDQINRAIECLDVTFPNQFYQPPRVCDDREQMATAAVVADMFQSISAFVLFVLLVYTTLKSKWAWGPGKVPVEKATMRPRIQYPPPSPFTHVAETRRIYVWIGIFAVAAFVSIAFILALLLHQNRIIPRMVNGFNQQTEISGWPRRNNRFRLALSGCIIALVLVAWLDLVAWKRRFLAYILAALFFWAAVACFIMFAMDVDDLEDANDLPCPTVAGGLDCRRSAYIGTAAVEFILGILLLIFVLYEFVLRVNRTWDTFYFYADSEWLRNHSLFVEQTDRESHDWKKFTMETGREYYYSPTLGISTRVRPRNYVDPDETYQEIAPPLAI